MQKSKIQRTKMIKTIFAAFCFIFISFLLIVTVYETHITQEYPSDNVKKNEILSDKYSILPSPSDLNFSSVFLVIDSLAIDEDEEFEDEKNKHDSGWYEEEEDDN